MYNYDYHRWIQPVPGHRNFLGESRAPLVGTSNDPNIAAVFGDSEGGPAVWGNNKRNDPAASGVLGTSDYGVGVWGKGSPSSRYV